MLDSEYEQLSIWGREYLGHQLSTLYLSGIFTYSCRVSEVDESSQEECSLTPLDSRGIALGCFVLARCLQLGQVVTRSEHKAQEYFAKVCNFYPILYSIFITT